MIGQKMGVRHFALSFASSTQDLITCRDMVGADTKIISKIESKQGLLNLKTIIFDLDETLVHCNEFTIGCDVVLPVTLPDG